MTKHRTPFQPSPNHSAPERIAPPVASDSSAADTLPKRWSAAREAKIAIRLLKGESLDGLSREIQQPASRVFEWRDRFLNGGEAAMKERAADPDVEASVDEKRRLQAIVERERTRRVIQRLSAQVAPCVLTKPIHESQQVLKSDPTETIIRVMLALNFELECEVLDFGEDMDVLAPQSLRECIARRVRKNASALHKGQQVNAR